MFTVTLHNIPEHMLIINSFSVECDTTNLDHCENVAQQRL